MNSSKDQGIDRTFHSLNKNSSFASFFRIFQEVFDQFLVVKKKQEKSTDAKDNHKEKEEDQNHICYLVGKVKAEKSFTFRKEVKR